MCDPDCDDPAPRLILRRAIQSQQFSLSELFVVVSLLALELGVAVHVSQLLAILPAAGLLSLAAIRFGDIHNFLLGGAVGYVIWLVVAWLYVRMRDISELTAACILIIVPAVGYLVGSLLTELQNIDH